MKHLPVVTAFLILFVGCNMNENKEARIQKLEKLNEQTTTRLELLENRMQALESNTNKE